MFVKVSITPSGVIEERSYNGRGQLTIGVPVTGLTVDNIQGFTVSGATPNIGEALVWDGNAWVPQQVQTTPTTTTTCYVSGFSSANYYLGTVGTVSGSRSGFTAAVLFKLNAPRDEGVFQYVFSCFQQFVNGGWSIGFDANRLTYQVTSGSSIIQNGVSNNADWTDLGFVNSKFVLATLSYNGATDRLEFYGNGNLVASANDIAFEPNSAQAPSLGVESNSQSDAFLGSIVGAAYHSSSHFSKQDIIAHFDACVTSGSMVDSPTVGFHNLWVVSGTTAPATLVDQIGNLDLYLTGTLTGASTTNPQWI